MTFKNSHALNVFYALGDMARKYNVSSKEVEETILRWALRKIGAMTQCEHLPEDVVVRRDSTRAHCKRCWTWMEVISKPGANYKGRFRPIKNKFEEDLLALQLSLGEDLK